MVFDIFYKYSIDCKYCLIEKYFYLNIIYKKFYCMFSRFSDNLLLLQSEIVVGSEASNTFIRWQLRIIIYSFEV